MIEQKNKIINNNCLIALKEMEDNSIDSIVSDPPYGINFMGKKWDYDVPSVEVWQECLRVLKPGGHALIACGTRTQHRMAVNLEDAGFEIRDIVAWVYGSGFPKSHKIGKAVDKLQGNERGIVEYKYQNRIPNGRSGLGLSGNDNLQIRKQDGDTKGSSPYEGWGTALKPAMELWTLCRKPLEEKTIASNVLKYGTGGLNIDACRVGTGDDRTKGGTGGMKTAYVGGELENKVERATGGRFPANLIHDGSDEVISGFPNSKSTGSASRFFYCAKASKSEKGEGNNHPTVKPIKLMRYLVRLITPKGGIVLDPFMGSGSTGIACKQEGFDFIGIEIDKEYLKIAKARIK